MADGVLHRRRASRVTRSCGRLAVLVCLAGRSREPLVLVRGSAGTLTARKERRGAVDGYWTAYRKRDGKLLKTYLGKAEKVTQHRLDEAARSLAEPADDLSPGEPAGAPPTAHQVQLRAAGGDPLLLSKLSVPALRRTLVPRASLSARIEEALERKLTVVSAPAGFGKSTLLSTWVAAAVSEADRRVAWLSLDSRDDDPARFWRYFVTALSRLRVRGAGKRRWRCSAHRKHRRSSPC